MSQFDWGVIDPNSKSGPQLALDLNKFRDAVNSSHKGGTRPAYITAGMLWVREVSSSKWDLVLYDGDTDFVIRSINPSNNTVLSIPSTQISGLGSAAEATLTTGNADKTEGRVLKVGDFGLAGETAPTAVDANLAVMGGWYSLASSGENRPPQISGPGWSVMVCPGGFQIASPATGNASNKGRLFARQVFAGAWSPWVEFFTSGNIPALISDPGMQAALESKALGVGQSWSNFTTSRALGVTYTNSTGRPIVVTVSAISSGNNLGSIVAIVSGTQIVIATTSTSNGTTWASLNNPVTLIVPVGATYSVNNNTNTNTITFWSELR